MHKGEIWLINLDPTIGAEIRKSRSAVIVSVDEIGILPLRVIVPITDWKDQYSQAAWMVPILQGQKMGRISDQLQMFFRSDPYQKNDSSTKSRFWIDADTTA